MHRAAIALAIGAACHFTSARVAASPSAAEALFLEGRALMERGEVDAACDKFESSYASEASSGTLLNLADCRAKQGKTATAWAHFVAAERLAAEQNRPPQRQEANRRRRELDARLSSLRLTASDPPPGFEVRVNGRKVNAGSFGSQVPLDPGRIVIEATAPDFQPYRVEVTLRSSNHALDVHLPRLEPARAPTAERVKVGEPSGRPDSAGPGALPWIIGGVGLSLVAAGSAFGIMALSSNAEAERLCGNKTTNCPKDSLAAETDRDREALLSSIGLGAGVVGVGVAGFLLLSSGDGDNRAERPLDVSAAVGPGRGFVLGTARF